MSLVNSEINIQNFDDSLELINKWGNFLKMTPWADTECLFDNLRYENAISWPIYCVHYESRMENGFKLKSHVMWTRETNKPGIEHLTRLAEILKIDLEKFRENTMQLSNFVHDKFYEGHRKEDIEEPPIHDLFQRLMNETLQLAYRTEIEEGRVNSKGVDVAITTCLRIDHLFSNKQIQVNLENYVQANETYVLQLGHLSFEQLGVLFENRENNSLNRCMGGSKQRIKILKKIAEKKLRRTYGDQQQQLKADLIHEDTTEEERAIKWLSEIDYPTNSRLIKSHSNTRSGRG